MVKPAYKEYVFLKTIVPNLDRTNISKLDRSINNK